MLKNQAPKNAEELFSMLENGWNNLSATLLTNLVDSIPLRCQAVIDSDGYATKW